MGSNTPATTTASSPAVPVPNEKPLNQTQLKNLRELVEGDFQDLRNQLFTKVERMKDAKKKEIDARYGDTASLDDASKRIKALVREAHDTLQAAVNDLRDQGIVPNPNSRRSYGITVDAPTSFMLDGRDEAERRLNDTVARLRSTINTVLSREERKIQRIVLLQGISASSAWQIIEDLPEADDLLGLVDAELSAENADDIRELMTGTDD